MSDFCPCFPASTMCPPGATCNYSWRRAEQMWGLWVRLRWVSGSLDNRRWLLCFRGICAAPVDRAAPHLLPNISCLIFVVFLTPLQPPAPPGWPGSWERPRQAVLTIHFLGLSVTWDMAWPGRCSSGLLKHPQSRPCTPEPSLHWPTAKHTDGLWSRLSFL